MQYVWIETTCRPALTSTTKELEAQWSRDLTFSSRVIMFVSMPETRLMLIFVGPVVRQSFPRSISEFYVDTGGRFCVESDQIART